MRPYRSMLFMPADRQRMLEKGPMTGADALILDLEDAVVMEAKNAARQMAREYIQGLAGVPVFVRLNAIATGHTFADLEAVVVPGLVGVVMAKAESTDEVVQVATWLGQRETVAGIESGTVEIVCMLESANAVRLGYDIATASPRVASVICSSGQNGDLQTDLACDWSVGGTEMLYARSKVLLDARAAGIRYPLDGVFVDIDNIDGLIADTNLSKRLGYKGRTIIHPKHVEHVNRIFTPSPQEVAYFRGLLATFEAAEADGRGSAVYEGRMIDFAMAFRARQVIDLAESVGPAQ